MAGPVSRSLKPLREKASFFGSVLGSWATTGEASNKQRVALVSTVGCLALVRRMGM